jgi:hypothetical protein
MNLVNSSGNASELFSKFNSPYLNSHENNPLYYEKNPHHPLMNNDRYQYYTTQLMSLYQSANASQHGGTSLNPKD